MDSRKPPGDVDIIKGLSRWTKGAIVVGPWEGFWQVVYDSGEEEVVPFRNTTVALRPAVGFSIHTPSHFMELRSTGRRNPPEGWPPTEQEAVAMLRGFSASAGRSTWQGESGRFTGENLITMSSDPRLEGSTCSYQLEIDGEHCVCVRTMPDGTRFDETWRRLSGAGSSPLAGAWESGEPDDLWFYLATAGHYGVMRASSSRPRQPADGTAYTDDEMYALWNGFGANAGARLETDASFDHWPMVGQVAGYEIRKHETFRLHAVSEDEFVAALPPYEGPDDAWRRIG